ncbi:MAG: nucleotidyltransferase [Ignavibacteriaceae bacterium]|nr:nucleotidyltransferase [Ignavibacteriaceae bacterium]
MEQKYRIGILKFILLLRMEKLTEKFTALFKSLCDEDVEYVLTGDFAIVLHGALRFTGDIDLFIRNSEENLVRLRTALNNVFADESIAEITVTELKSYAVIRYGTPDDFFIDIISNIGEKFSFEDLIFQEIDFNGIKIKLASPDTLYKMKERTFRAVDQDDLLFLRDKIRNKK